MRRLFCVIFVGLLVSSCSSEKKIQPDDPLSLFEKTHQLNGEVIKLNREVIGSFGLRLAKIDSILVVYDVTKADDKFIFVIDVKNGKVIKKIVEVGWGPCEFSMLLGIKADTEAKVFNFMDPNKRQYFEIGLKELLEDSLIRPCPRLINTFVDGERGNTSFIDVLEMNDHYIGYGPKTNESMFSILNSSGEVIKNVHDYPVLEGNFPNKETIARQVFFGVINKQPHGEKIACVAQPGLLSIYEFNAGNLTLNFEFQSIKPDFDVDGNRKIQKKDAKLGYISSFVNENKIFVGYCSKSLKELMDEGSDNYIDHLLVFDWEGNPEICYKLNQNIAGFSVDENNEFIIATAHLPEPGIMKFRLP